MPYSLAAHLPRILCGLAVVVLPAAYYALYINTGFNFSDEGNYAQIAYELFLGRDAGELALGYGILWFKFGEWLFHIFGVDFLLVRLFFFVCIVVTNVLVFYTVTLATGSRPIAFFAAAVTALVPAFPATAFYPLCVMVNVAAQMRLAQTRICGWHAALAGAALSFSFQIRPDFGYIFIFPLLIVLWLASRSSVSSNGQTEPSVGLRHLAVYALAGFLIVQLAGLAAAVAGGYADVVLGQYAARR